MSRVTFLVALKVLLVPTMAQVAPLCGDGFGLTNLFLHQWVEKHRDAVGCAHRHCPSAEEHSTGILLELGKGTVACG